MRSLALVLEQEARARGVSILWRKFSRIPRNEGEKVGRRVVVEHEEEDEVVEEEGVEMEGKITRGMYIIFYSTFTNLL